MIRAHTVKLEYTYREILNYVGDDHVAEQVAQNVLWHLGVDVYRITNPEVIKSESITQGKKSVELE